MNISLKQLRAFTAVAQGSSFAGACEKLHISQPALSVSIRNMEEAVGGALFKRTTRNVELTPEGRDFLPKALRLQSDWDRAFDDLQRAFTLQQGKLTVAVMPSFAMNQFPEAVARFRESFPGINLKIEDIVMEDVIEAVLADRVELGITFKPEQLEEVDFVPLFTDRFVAILHSGHPLCKKKSIYWKELANDTFIGMNLGSWTRQATDGAFASVDVKPLEIFEANQLATIGGMVLAGVGVSVVPALCQGYMQSLGVICRPINRPSVEREVGLFTHKHRPLSTAAQEFGSCLRNRKYN
ncbi:MAG: LysR family transcriptional regulator [Pseudomonadales bacterium]